MAEEGQKAWQAWIDGCQIYPRTPFKDIDGELKIAWRFVERTIANEALRRAVEFVEHCADHCVGEEEIYVLTQAAKGLRALIKEPGHE